MKVRDGIDSRIKGDKKPLKNETGFMRYASRYKRNA